MIPAIIAAGLFQGFSSLIGTMIGEGTIDGTLDSDTNICIDWEQFRLFAVFTGVNAAKNLKQRKP